MTAARAVRRQRQVALKKSLFPIERNPPWDMHKPDRRSSPDGNVGRGESQPRVHGKVLGTVTGLTRRGSGLHPDGFCNITSLPRLSGCCCRQPWLAEGVSWEILRRQKPPRFARAAPRRWHQQCEGSACREYFNAALHPGRDGFSVGLDKSLRPGIAHLSISQRRKSRS